MGARPLRRVIQNKVEDVLSDGLLGGQFHNGDTVRIEVKDKAVVLTPAVKPEKPEAPTDPEQAVLPTL
jgi:ATP-dependent Clp protease ATP-binding subunit ClpC